MKVSVIIPVKNRASLLRLTLDNVLAQSLSPYEVIVVDDASTDDIDSVIRDYKKDVTFLKSKGTGPGGARNTGLGIATGNAIQFFDSDDLMTKNKLEVQSQLLEKNNADFVYGPFVKAIEKDGQWQQADVIMQYYPLPKGNMADFVLQGWCNITQSVLFSRDLLNEVGGMREDLTTHEDYEFWFRVGKLAKTFIHENESCVIYRQHQFQVTDLNVADKTRWMEGIMAMKYIEAGIDYKPAAGSLRLFKGRYGFSKSQYKKTFNDTQVNASFSEFLNLPYFKLKNKLGRITTGTPWQVMHGPSKSEEAFNHYTSLLIK